MTQNRLNIDTGGLPQASEHLAAAWRWLCEGRRHAPAQADVWHLRYHWDTQQQSLLTTLLAGEYRLSPMLIVGQGNEQKAMWGAQDALVLKWVALQVAPLLPLHARCEHIKGHEGGPASVRKMSAALVRRGYRWVLRTDVKGYYANIDKAQLLDQVCRHITHPVLRSLITQYVHYTVEHGGTFHTPEKGIGRSCPLSPLMGALYLHEMDEHFGREMQANKIYYARFMDDIVVLTHSRWQLRKHVSKLNQLLAEKHLRQHPDKTFIGRTVRGFDWMGAWLEPQGVTDIAPRAKANHREKVRRLYERAWRWREPKGVTQRRVSIYRWRWAIWAAALLALPCTATAERVVVPAGVSGVVGYTAVKVGQVRTPGTYIGAPEYTVCLSTRPTCVSEGRASWDGQAKGPTTGSYGWAIPGPTSGAVLVPVGTISWVRKLFDGKIVSGNLLLTLSGGTSSWAPADAFGGIDPPQNVPHHVNTLGYLQSAITGGPALQSPRWDSTFTRTSTASIRFAIDAPAGGLTPGLYGHGGFYIHLLDNHAASTNLDQASILPYLDIVVANYSCAISVSDNAVSLAPLSPTATVNATVSCSDSTSSLSPVSADIMLQAYHAGSSTISADAKDLVPSGAPGVTVQGTWGPTPKACGASDMYFDGRDSPRIATIKPGEQNITRTEPVSFRLCGTAPPGAYSAQAILSVVMR
ncbi:reverse transcriptase domain-containing protein [Enterobacter ludwigii]|uniref:reverse transcriptase domain-containing protein n=1 Tax=Enterobacter ludwigii TaxID=299767 RepID=UPI003BEEF357